MLSTLEPVSRSGQQQSLDEIEMISQVNTTTITTNGASGDGKTAENDQYPRTSH